MDKKTRTDEAGGTTNSQIEEKIVAFAEQLGWLVGTVQAKAEGWFDRPALIKEVKRIRDQASELLTQVSGSGEAAAEPVTAPRKSRGPVDAPGKKHRKPPPRQRMAGRTAPVRGSKRSGKRGMRG